MPQSFGFQIEPAHDRSLPSKVKGDGTWVENFIRLGMRKNLLFSKKNLGKPFRGCPQIQDPMGLSSAGLLDDVRAASYPGA
jgi:hypothetical protein